jgi:membrane protease YdiL (CAAX protease family)
VSLLDVTAPVAERARTLGWLWKGHLFLFDKELGRSSYGEKTGFRLLMLVAVLELVRLAILRITLLPFWVQSPLILVVVLLSVRVVLPFREIGLRSWREWNRIEKSYFIQVVIIANVIFPMTLGSGLAAAFAQQPASTLLWETFIPRTLRGFSQEVVYRGMLQTELVRRWGTILGILASNALYTFGPEHYYYFGSRPSLAVPMFGSIFGIGLLFAVIFHRSRNLWIVAIMHAIGNAYIVTALGGIR